MMMELLIPFRIEERPGGRRKLFLMLLMEVELSRLKYLAIARAAPREMS